MYRCPSCQSTKIMPVASSANTLSQRPMFPKSLLFLVASIFALLLLGVFSLFKFFLDSEIGTTLSLAILIVFACLAISSVLFMKDFPQFKQSLQEYIRNQKHWKCRECGTDWQN